MIENLDRIKLSDNNEYLVVSNCELDNHKYLYLVNVNDNTIVKFMEYKDNKLEEIGGNEKIIITKLIKAFSIDIQKFYGENNASN